MPRDNSNTAQTRSQPAPYSRPTPTLGSVPTKSSVIDPSIDSAISSLSQLTSSIDAITAQQSAASGGASAISPGTKRPGACAECKRLKLGCDRNWPCSSCKRRKVAHLCPEGQLESKEINLAQRQIKGLLDRIGSLERLLQDHDVEFDPFNPKDDPTFNFEVDDASPSGGAGGGSGASASGCGGVIVKGVRRKKGVAAADHHSLAGGQLKVASNGANEWHGVKASASHDFSVARETRSLCIPEVSDDDIPPYLVDLPDEAQCRVYVHNYFVNCDWMHRLLQEDEHMNDWNLFWRSSSAVIHRLPRHKFAVHLLVLALGYVSECGPTDDLSKPDQWVKGAQLCLGGLGVGFTMGVTLDTVAALNLLAQYLLNAEARDAASAAWNVIGIALRLCQSMGLHYVGTWDEQDIDYRQRLWWETIAMDRFLSLSLGRPYMARSSQTAWPIALDSYGFVREGVKRAFSNEHGDFTTPSSLPFHWFKYRLCIILDQCMNDLDSPFAPRPALVQKVNHSLHAIMSELPPFLRCDAPDLDPFAGLDGLPEQEQKKVVAQAHMFHLLVHMCHLALHRPFFVGEIRSDPGMMGGDSFDQMILSARGLTMTLRRIRSALPSLSMFWKSFVAETFTAAVVQAAVVIATPSTLAATECWNDFRESVKLFELFATEGHSIANATLDTLNRLTCDASDFAPTSRRSFAQTMTQGSQRLAIFDSGTIKTQSGIDIIALLQMSSRYFPPKTTQTSSNVSQLNTTTIGMQQPSRSIDLASGGGDARHGTDIPRPPWLQSHPPPPTDRYMVDSPVVDGWSRQPHDPEHAQSAGPSNVLYGPTLHPGAPAARFATGRLDGPATDWNATQNEIDLRQLNPPESNVPPELLEQYVGGSRTARPADFRTAYPLSSSTAPTTSHVRRRDPNEWQEDVDLDAVGSPNQDMLNVLGHVSQQQHSMRSKQYVETRPSHVTNLAPRSNAGSGNVGRSTGGHFPSSSTGFDYVASSGSCSPSHAFREDPRDAARQAKVAAAAVVYSGGGSGGGGGGGVSGGAGGTSSWDGSGGGSYLTGADDVTMLGSMAEPSNGLHASMKHHTTGLSVSSSSGDGNADLSGSNWA